jgi:acetyl-CoA carboxylase carboxyl transferase subunit alpha
MLEHSVYSVAAPEASAAILWRDSSKAPDAARAMRITAQDLLTLEIVDAIIPEPEGGAHMNANAITADLGAALREHLDDLVKFSVDELLANRYAKYRAIGSFQEGQHKLFTHVSDNTPTSF